MPITKRYSQNGEVVILTATLIEATNPEEPLCVDYSDDGKTITISYDLNNVNPTEELLYSPKEPNAILTIKLTEEN